MYVFFEGEIRLRRESTDAVARAFTMAAGDISGVLPYSRLQYFRATGRATVTTRVARFNKQIFPEMMHRMPPLSERLVGLMMDRVRENTRQDEQKTKLASLGKLAAGLSHELNNPAGAAKRAAASLKETRLKLRNAYLRLDCRELSTAQREFIGKFENTAIDRGVSSTSVNSLEQADREEELLDWMDSRGVLDGHQLTGNLVEAGVTVPELEGLADNVGIDALTDVLTRMHLSIQAARLVSEIEVSTNRISEIVKAVKEYTYMDQAPEQEIDIHSGLESTLLILAYKLRKSPSQYSASLTAACPRSAPTEQN